MPIQGHRHACGQWSLVPRANGPAWHLDPIETQWLADLGLLDLIPANRRPVTACSGGCVAGRACEHGLGDVSHAGSEWREVFVVAWGVHYWVRTASLVSPKARFRTWTSPFAASYTQQHPSLSYVDCTGSFRLYAGLQWQHQPADAAGSDSDE
jgi:hypothetical protein